MTVIEIVNECLAQGLARDDLDSWKNSRVTVSLGIARGRQVVRVHIDMKVTVAQLDTETLPVNVLAGAVRSARQAVTAGTFH